MLNVVREYALAQLGVSDEMDALRQAHALYYLSLAGQAEPELRGPEAGEWLDLLEQEYDNLRAALTWTRDRGDAATKLRLATAFSHLWVVRGRLREGRARVEELLDWAWPESSEDGGAPVDATGVTPDGQRAQALLLRGQ